MNIRKFFSSCLLLVFLLAVIYSAAWLMLATITKNKIAAEFKHLKTHNIEIKYKQLASSGFPYSLKLNFSDLEIKFKPKASDQTFFITLDNLQVSSNFTGASYILRIKDKCEILDAYQDKIYTLNFIEPARFKIKYSESFLFQKLHADFWKKLNRISYFIEETEIVTYKPNAANDKIKRSFAKLTKKPIAGEGYQIEINSDVVLETSLLNSMHQREELNTKSYFKVNFLENKNNTSELNGVESILDITAHTENLGVGIKGIVHYNQQDAMPYGKLSIFLKNYPEFFARITSNKPMFKDYMQNLFEKLSDINEAKTNLTIVIAKEAKGQLLIGNKTISEIGGDLMGK
jgi:hypothetical protein